MTKSQLINSYLSKYNYAKGHDYVWNDLKPYQRKLLKAQLKTALNHVYRLAILDVQRKINSL